MKDEEDTKMVIVMRTDLSMRKGKMMAQAAHAALAFLLNNNSSKKAAVLRTELSKKEATWLFGSQTKIVVGVDSLGALDDIVFKAQVKGIEVNVITDAGRTEFHGVPTVTCAALGPGLIDEIDELTAHLKLL